MSSKLSVSEVNSLRDDQFEVIFGNVIELCDDAAKAVKNERPFTSIKEICKAFWNYLDDLDIDGKLTILKLHPELAGRLAAQGELTKESANEQKSAGLSDITSDLKEIINDSNKRYKAKFGFPFIICARENNKVQSIVTGLYNRYKNTREEEINTGIAEVKKICKLRILDIVKDDDIWNVENTLI